MSDEMNASDWEAQIALVWATTASLTDAEVVGVIDALAADRGESDAAAVFERASARDYVGREADAEPLYRRAIELGLDENRHPQAVIQLASTLRNLGRANEAVTLLDAHLERFPNDRWSAPARAFLALSLASAGQQRRALAVSLDALASTLPAYSNAVRRYASELES
jgi:tetratricopeptide (TPR) repeat protein